MESNNGGRFNPDFMNSMSCMSFAIGLMNLKENLQQSKNNDIIDQIGEKTNVMVGILEKDIEQQNQILYQQNKMLQDIMKRLQKLQENKS